MKGQFYINDKDAYTEWGITLAPSARAALMTPAALKDPIVSRSRMEHGSRYINDPKVAEREINLNINLTARTEEDFLARYSRFCEELEKGELVLRIDQTQAYYHTLYRSCTQYQEWGMGIAKFTLRLTEPNPKNRTR